jgi:hypothetical protein
MPASPDLAMGVPGGRPTASTGLLGPPPATACFWRKINEVTAEFKMRGCSYLFAEMHYSSLLATYRPY